MFRIDTPSAVTTAPAPAAVGTQGYFTTATVVSHDWLNATQESIALTIEGAGLTLDKASNGQLASAIGGAYGVKSHVSDTTSVTTRHTRVIVAATNSEASASNAICAGTYGSSNGGAQSAIVGSFGCEIASNNATTAMAGCHECTAPSTTTQNVLFGGSRGCKVTATHAALLGSLNAEITDNYSVGWGYDASALVASNANQNLTGLINTQTGAVHFGGDLGIGGDVDAGTGATVTLASNGAIGCASVTATGAVGCASVAATGAVGCASVAATGDITVGGGYGVTGATMFGVSGAISANGGITSDANVQCGSASVFSRGSDNGLTTTFLIANGDTVTVKGGIITGIA